MNENTSNPFVITEETVAEATTYLTLADKLGIARGIAEESIEDNLNDTQNESARSVIPTLPRLKVCNLALMRSSLLLVLLTKYLHIDIPNKISSDTLDYYASAHPVNQLQRFKSLGERNVKDIAFDIVNDWRELCKITENEVNSILSAENDTLARLGATMALFATPENVKSMFGELQATAAQFADTAEKAQGKRAEIAETVKKSKESGAKPAETENDSKE